MSEALTLSPLPTFIDHAAKLQRWDFAVSGGTYTICWHGLEFYWTGSYTHEDGITEELSRMTAGKVAEIAGLSPQEWEG